MGKKKYKKKPLLNLSSCSAIFMCITIPNKTNKGYEAFLFLSFLL